VALDTIQLHVKPSDMPRDDKVTGGWHKHKCSKCGHVWGHDGKETQKVSPTLYALAHKCPKCRTPNNIAVEQTTEHTMATAITEKNERTVEERMKDFKNIEVINAGSQIILPENPTPMDLETGAAWLLAKKAEEESKAGIYEVIEGVPLDAAHAFIQSLRKTFGWIKTKPETFLWIETPPKLLGVVVNPEGATVQVPWGQFEIPGVDGFLKTTSAVIDGQIKLVITGEVKHKNLRAVNQMIQDAREYLKLHSIYKGMAVKVKFTEVDDDAPANPFLNQPKIIKTGEIRPDELVFNEDTENLVRVNLWAIIEHLEAVRRAQIPVKRGILLHGRPGTGKTLAALATAVLSVKNAVTFIELGDPKQLSEAIHFARQNAPAVVFVEDIDRLDRGEDNAFGGRSDYFNEVLNTVDGLTGKNEEVIIVFTTNYVERINPAMLRPGRLDAVIEIDPPNAKSVERLIRMYSRGMLDEKEDLAPVGSILQGEIPAVVREVVERAKLTAIVAGRPKTITATDLRVSAVGMRKHLDLLKETPKKEYGDDIERAAELLVEGLGKIMANGSGKALVQ